LMKSRRCIGLHFRYNSRRMSTRSPGGCAAQLFLPQAGNFRQAAGQPGAGLICIKPAGGAICEIACCGHP
jgi:hypothetical protein